MAYDAPITLPDPVETDARLAAIVESTDDAIIGKDLRGMITSWNPSAERIFGYTAEEAIGQSILIIIPPELQAEEAQILERVKHGERITHYGTIRRAKDGHDVEVSLTISPIKDRDGKIIGASKISRDFTEHNRVRKELDHARKKYTRDLEKKVEERTARLQSTLTELETFSYSVSHDLRSPLRAMQQYAQVLMDDYGDKLDENGRRCLERITDSSVRLDTLIHDLLQYSRISRSNVELHCVELEPLVCEVISLRLRLQPPRAEIRIERPLAAVLGNPVYLHQCVSNLLMNAAKFVPAGVTPQIRVWTELVGSSVRLCIQDNGIGIAPELQSRVFGLFERLGNDKAYEGTGIGLAIVRKAAERMNGKVGFESEPGKGSKFWIELPHSEQATRARGAL